MMIEDARSSMGIKCSTSITSTSQIGGALSEAGAMQAGELMQDYKTGHLVKASPRGQFFGQIVGSTAGIFASTAAYKVGDGYEKMFVLSLMFRMLIAFLLILHSYMSAHMSFLDRICLLPLLDSGSISLV